MAKEDMMLPIKTDKDIIRYLREALRVQEHHTNNMASKYCKIYKMYKASTHFVHLAWLDHCPNVVVDARASGCKIVCSSAGGTR